MLEVTNPKAELLLYHTIFYTLVTLHLLVPGDRSESYAQEVWELKK